MARSSATGARYMPAKDNFRVDARTRTADADTALVFVRPRKVAGRRYKRGDSAPESLSATLRARLVDQRILVPAEELTYTER
ncbi:MAG: hypothetical protein U5L06_12225 [Rhodovibrio sp.]|nr:hypothetical protein [Rhodovibrio sp.]